MVSFAKRWNIIVLKHFILFLPIIIKFLFLVSLTILISYISFLVKEYIWDELFKFVFFPLAFVLLNYSFIRLVQWLIEYYNNLLILRDDQIICINSSFILRDDIEIIEAFKVIKIDLFSRGLFANIFWFWTIVVELQTKEQREFIFMPNPYRVINHLKSQRDYVLESRWKKTSYIVEIEDEIEDEKN